MRAGMLISMALVVAAPAAAHDFWIQPTRFATGIGEPLPFTLLVGHGVYRQRWGVATSRVLRFSDISVTEQRNQRGVLHTDSGDDDGSLTFTTAGTHVVVLETGPAQSILPAIRFNDYLKVEGLAPAIAARARTGRTNSEGREFYSRRAKTLIEVGASTDPQPQVMRPAGLKLEIVPQKNPYRLRPGEKLPVRILYEGRPLPGATVKLNNLDSDAEPLAQQLTDAAGMANFAVPLRGNWQLNVIWTKVLPNNPLAEFDTVFSSLSFGFDRSRRSR